MAGEERVKRLAVLIDADNASPKIADGLFDEVAKIGEASLRRIYGDFSDNHLRGWAEILARHAILPQQQFAYTTGKNSSDITLVIDAMDLMHSGRFDGFCLVSSDSDFTRLAARLREQGMDVYGIGQQKTPEAFRQACTRFIFTENFVTGDAAGAKAKKATPVIEALPLLEKAIGELEEDADGWFRLGTVGQRLNNLSPEFDARTFGHGKLSDLVAAIPQFEIDRQGPQGPRMRLKRKPARRRKPAAKTPKAAKAAG
ncbi:MAG: NYN domain-containing protein [Rhodobacteraceae bacterium]|nr:NYN domain-containing protein [Paracoccaceae bacterium]